MNNLFTKLPDELKIKIYEYDPTYRLKYNDVVKDLSKFLPLREDILEFLCKTNEKRQILHCKRAYKWYKYDVGEWYGIDYFYEWVSDHREMLNHDLVDFMCMTLWDYDNLDFMSLFDDYESIQQKTRKKIKKKYFAMFFVYYVLDYEDYFTMQG